MKIACLQFDPKLGEIAQNILRAEAILEEASVDELDLIVLPEMALSGYKFLSLEAIQAYLEPTAAGISTRWAKVIAKRYDCIVSIGYPEYAAPDHALPNASTSPFGNNFNSTVTVAPDGKILAHYRKSFLYMTDETWASEGSGFYAGVLPLRGGCRVAMGICMDINPYKFEAPFEKCEFATHAVTSGAELVVLSMAWSSLQLTSEDLKDHALQPDLATLSYWVSRFRPLQEKDTNVPTILVMSNRCGTEHDTNYAGTSTVMRLCGERVDLWEVLGKGEERCLVVDTEMHPKFSLLMQPLTAEEQINETPDV